MNAQIVLTLVIVILLGIAIYYQFYREGFVYLPSNDEETKCICVCDSVAKDEDSVAKDEDSVAKDSLKGVDELKEGYDILYPEYVTDIPQYYAGYNGTLLPEYPYFYPYYFWEGTTYGPYGDDGNGLGVGGGWSRWGRHGGGGGHRGGHGHHGGGGGHH
jgi:uncharacterized membrane protein YgcG